MKFIDENKQVCVEIETHQPDLNEYRFVVLRGDLKVATEPKERAAAISKMAKEGKRKLSTNFLAVHGIKKEECWESLNPEKSIVIVKLEQVAEKFSLRSP